MLIGLTEQHCITKKQHGFFKQRKASLKLSKCVLVLDFAENYSIIVQDATQDIHWNNSQATIHPFVLYYRDDNTNLVQQITYASISYHTIYNIIAIYTFVKKLLLEYLKPSFLHIKKVIYFSDSSAAQYENYKNFTNLSSMKIILIWKQNGTFLPCPMGKILVMVLAVLWTDWPLMLAFRDLSQSKFWMPSSCLNLQTVRLLMSQPHSVKENIPFLSPGFQIAVPSRELATIMSLFHVETTLLWIKYLEALPKIYLSNKKKKFCLLSTLYLDEWYCGVVNYVWQKIVMWTLNFFTQMVLLPSSFGLVMRTLAGSQYIISLQK